MSLQENLHSPRWKKAVLPLTDSEYVAPIERSLKAVIPFEEQFQPLIDSMKKEKEEVDRR